MMWKECERSSRKLERTMRSTSRRSHSSVGCGTIQRVATGCFLWALVLAVGLPSVDAFQTVPMTRISLLRLDTTFLLQSSSGSETESLSEHSKRESKYSSWSERLRLPDATEAYSAPVEELARKLSGLLSDLAKGSYSKTLGQLSASSVAVSKNLRQSSIVAAGLIAEYAKDSCTFVGQCSAASVAAGKNLVQTSWWASPMFACLIPVYHALVLQQGASMPHWWRVFPMDHLWASPDAIAIVGFFLVSNLAYFLASAYLIAMFPPVLSASSSTATSAAAAEESQAKMGRLNTMLSLKPTRHTGLGLWVAAAGAISTLFHSFQALGDYGIAEGLCFIDHGVALTAIFYFWRVLGRPSPATCGVSLAGLVTLVLTHPGYAYLHSTWHVLSASAAILWATQSPAGATMNNETSSPQES